jgi:hypothetical protein
LTTLVDASIRTLISGVAFLCAAAVHAAHYGTLPVAPASTSATLTISDHAPACTDPRANCIETSGAVRAYPVANGDRITLNWTNDTEIADGIIRFGNLYLPLSGATNGSATPVTVELELANSNPPVQVIVEYSGTRHHVPLTPGAWQRISIYNPNEQVLYLRFEPPRATASPN